MAERYSPRTAGFRIELHPKPYAKSVAETAVEAEKEVDAFYPNYPHLFLSTMLHGFIQGRPNGNTRTMEYLRQMGLDTPIVSAFDQAAETVRDQFEARTGIPYHQVTWLNEVPFTTTPNQVRIIDALANEDSTPREILDRLQERARMNGGANILDLMTKLLRDPKRKVLIDGKPYTQTEILGFYRSLMKNPLKDAQQQEPRYAPVGEDDTAEAPSFIQKLYRQSPDRQFAALVASLLSYYYFSFEGADFAADLEHKRKMGIFNARADQIGFLPLQNGETNQRIINEALPAFAHHLNNKSMLNPQEVEALTRLVRAVEQGEIAFYLHEIKTEMFHTKLVTRADGTKAKVQTSFAPRLIEPKHLRDVSHSIAAMFFALQNLTMHPQNDQGDRNGFSELMSDDYETRARAFATVFRRFRHFFSHPSASVLTKIYYPVIDVAEAADESGIPEKTINSELVAAVRPVTSSLVMPTRDLYRAVVRRAYTIFKEVQDNGKQRTTPLDEIVT